MSAQRPTGLAAHLHLLRMPLILLAATALLLIMTWVLAWRPWRGSLQQLEQQRLQWQELQQRARGEDEARARLDDVMTDFRQLQHQQLLVPEKRLDWVERLAREGSGPYLKLRYTIDAQRKLLSPMPAMPATPDVRASRVKLHMRALHEAYGLDFFDRLRRDAPGPHGVQQCLLRLDQQQSAALPVELECTLELFSIVPVSVGAMPLLPELPAR